MKLSNGENRQSLPIVKVELDLEKSLVEQLSIMENYTKISKSEIVATALKRFISAHKDYFPEDQRS